MRSRLCITLLAAAVGASAFVAAAAPSSEQARARSGPESLRVQVLNTYPHDPRAFVQGLVLDGATLYESTGQEGESSVRRVDLTTGRVLQKADQPAPIFSEGLAVVGANLIQLTWKNGIAYQYDKKTFARTKEWGYSGEGWGACYDGQALVTSDGSDRLTYRDAASMGMRRVVHVTLNGKALDQLNELECVDGSVWANVWQTERIVRIDAKTGRVTGVVDAPNLLTPDERSRADVLNGIAWDPATKTFLITGKWWPKLFRVKFVP